MIAENGVVPAKRRGSAFGTSKSRVCHQANFASICKYMFCTCTCRRTTYVHIRNLCGIISIQSGASPIDIKNGLSSQYVSRKRNAICNSTVLSGQGFVPMYVNLRSTTFRKKLHQPAHVHINICLKHV